MFRHNANANKSIQKTDENVSNSTSTRRWIHIFSLESCTRKKRTKQDFDRRIKLLGFVLFVVHEKKNIILIIIFFLCFVFTCALLENKTNEAYKRKTSNATGLTVRFLVFRTCTWTTEFLWFTSTWISNE